MFNGRADSINIIDRSPDTWHTLMHELCPDDGGAISYHVSLEIWAWQVYVICELCLMRHDDIADNMIWTMSATSDMCPTHMHQSHIIPSFYAQKSWFERLNLHVFWGVFWACGGVDSRSFHQKPPRDMIEPSLPLTLSEGEKMKIWIAKSGRDKNLKICLGWWLEGSSRVVSCKITKSQVKMWKMRWCENAKNGEIDMKTPPNTPWNTWFEMFLSMNSMKWPKSGLQKLTYRGMLTYFDSLVKQPSQTHFEVRWRCFGWCFRICHFRGVCASRTGAETRLKPKTMHFFTPPPRFPEDIMTHFTATSSPRHHFFGEVDFHFLSTPHLARSQDIDHPQ